MRCNPSFKNTLILSVNGAVSDFVNVGDQEVVWIEVNIDGDPGCKSVLRGEIAQPATAGTGKGKIELVLLMELFTVRVG